MPRADDRDRERKRRGSASSRNESEREECSKSNSEGPWSALSRARASVSSPSSRGSGKRTRSEASGGGYVGLEVRVEDDVAFRAWEAAFERLLVDADACGLGCAATGDATDSFEEMVDAVFDRSTALSDVDAWPLDGARATNGRRNDSETTKSAVKLLRACAKAFDTSRRVRELCTKAERSERGLLEWKKVEDELIRSWSELLTTSVSTRMVDVRQDVACTCTTHTSALEREIARRLKEGDIAGERGRRLPHLNVMAQAFRTINASFDYCAQALHDVVFQPLNVFSAADVTGENFDSGAHFMIWAIRAVQLVSDLSAMKECFHHRMSHFTGREFLGWSRTSLEVFYHSLSSLKGTSIPELLGAWHGRHQNVQSCERTREVCYSELCWLIELLPAMHFSLPTKGARERIRWLPDVRFSEKLQRKLTRHALAVISLCMKQLLIDVEAAETDFRKLPPWTKALIATIECNRSHSAKELAREILIKLDVGFVFAHHAANAAHDAADGESWDAHEEVKACMSALFSMLSVSPGKLKSSNVMSLVEPLVSIFRFLRRRRSCAQHRDSLDYDAEWKLCAVFACLALSSDKQHDPAVEFDMTVSRCEEATKTVQAQVSRHYDDVEAVITNILALRSADITRAALQADVVTKDKVIPAALAALTMFVRKNPDLRRRFSESSGAVEALFDIRECKGMQAGRVTSACILAFEEHHSLVQNLYEPKVSTDKKGERVTEISGWDVDKLRRSLRALADLVKESPVSALGFDNSILEVVCIDRRLQILMSKFTSSLRTKLDLGDDLERFHDQAFENWVFRLLVSPSKTIEAAEAEIQRSGLMPTEFTCPLVELIAAEKLAYVGEASSFWQSITEWYEEVIGHMKTVKDGLRVEDELADICCILMDGDTDSSSSHVGIIVPILMLLHKCRTLQEQNLVSELEVPGIGEIEKEACYVIGLLATKVGNQNRIADSFKVDSKNGIEQLIPLLRRYQPSSDGSNAMENTANMSITRRASDALTNLAHENSRIKNMVRNAGGIPPLVNLLEAQDKKVQRAAASALRTLAFKNGENKNQIVECGALPKLIFMARSEDVQLHKEAIGVIGNLVHSSPHIKRRALDEGALQPVIELLKSSCSETQREAALLLGQFAARLDPPAPGDLDYRTKIVQRGAVESLIKMLSRYREPGLREMAAFALGRLAQSGDNQVGICHSDGLQPLIALLESEIEDIANGLRHNHAGKSDAEIEKDAKRFVDNLQHNAAFALYGLADNHDNVAKMLKENAFMRLKYSNLEVDQSKQCVEKTLKRLAERIVRSDVFNYLSFIISNGKPLERERVALALAWLCSADNPQDMYTVFITKGGLAVLSNMLLGKPAESIDLSEATSGLGGGKRIVNVVMEALREIKNKLSPLNAQESHTTPPPSTPTAEEHMPANFKDPELSDVTFVINSEDGTNFTFAAHQIAFTHASDAFLSILNDGEHLPDGSLRVNVENVSITALEAVMDFIYTGTLEQMSTVRDESYLREKCEEVLAAATLFDLPGLTHLVEKFFIETVHLDSLTLQRTCELYAAAKDHGAAAIQDCLLNFVLQKYDKHWVEDEGNGLGLGAYKARVKKIVDCFGTGITELIRKLFVERHNALNRTHEDVVIREA